MTSRALSALAAPPAFEVLLSCVRCDPPDRLRLRVVDAVRNEGALYRAATHHGLSSLLYLRLQENGLHALLAPQEWDRLQAAHAASAVLQADLIDTALDLLDRLRRAGVSRALPMKGIALAAFLWPEYLPRDMLDVDLLVAPEEYDQALEVFAQAGLVCPLGSRVPKPWQSHTLLRRGSVAVEPHWRAWGAVPLHPFPAPAASDLWERAVERRLGDAAAMVPGWEDAVIMHVVALARDRFLVPLRAWADIRWLTAAAPVGRDPDRLPALAQDLHVSRLLSLVTRFTAEVFGGEALSPVCPAPLREESYDSLRPILWRRLLDERQSANVPDTLALAMAGQLRAKGRNRPEGEWKDDLPGSLQSPADDWFARSVGREWRQLVGRGAAVAVYLAKTLVSSAHRQALRDEIALLRNAREDVPEVAPR